MWQRGSRVALLACGSFNPPTLMHLRLLEVARDHLQMIKKCEVPEGIVSPVGSYFVKPHLVSAKHRFAMVKAATADSTWIRADDWECTQEEWCRTLSVLSHHRTELRARLGDDVGLALVVGGDVVDSFTRIMEDGQPLWQPQDIVDIIGEFGLVVIAREGSDPMKALRSIPQLEPVLDNVQVVWDEACPCAVSSTLLRAAILEGRSVKYATPDGVVEYIRTHGLYK